jgi:hypothetical protein
MFRRFRGDGVWEASWAELHMALRERLGRKTSSSAAALDSRPVKLAENGAVDGFTMHDNRCRLRDGHRFFTEMRPDGEVAPIPHLPRISAGTVGSSHNGHSELRQRVMGRQKADVRTGLLHALTTRSRQLVE